MTEHNPAIQAFVQRVIAQDLLHKIIATAEQDRTAAVAACDSALGIMAARAPEASPYFGAIRSECEWWVDMASDTERMNMLAAILRRISRERINTINARKTAIVAIWNTLDAQERAAFLDRVDPGPSAEG